MVADTLTFRQVDGALELDLLGHSTESLSMHKNALPKGGIEDYMEAIIKREISINPLSILDFAPNLPRYSREILITDNFAGQSFDSLIILGDALENLRKFPDEFF